MKTRLELFMHLFRKRNIFAQGLSERIFESAFDSFSIVNDFHLDAKEKSANETKNAKLR